MRRERRRGHVGVETTGERRGQACVGLVMLRQKSQRRLLQYICRHSCVSMGVPWDCEASVGVTQETACDGSPVESLRRRYVNSRAGLNQDYTQECSGSRGGTTRSVRVAVPCKGIQLIAANVVEGPKRRKMLEGTAGRLLLLNCSKGAGMTVWSKWAAGILARLLPARRPSRLLPGWSVFAKR